VRRNAFFAFQPENDLPFQAGEQPAPGNVNKSKKAK
jgi:hypothetical protein